MFIIKNNMFGIVVMMLIVIAAVTDDVRRYKISNKIIIIGYVSAIINLAISVCLKSDILTYIFGGIIGFGLMFIAYAIGAVGAGDVKLAGICGLFLGRKLIFYMLGVSFVSAVVIGMLGIVTKKSPNVVYAGYNMHKMHFSVAMLCGCIFAIVQLFL